MPHATLRLVPGVNVTDTPVLNQAGVSVSNLIRYFPDKVGGALIQKLGGWVRFFPSKMAAIARALWAWEDTNATAHLAVATQNLPATSTAQLSVITNNVQKIITPTFATTNNITPAASTTMGSPVVTITDTTTTGITSYDVVYIQTHISVGGIILFGMYQTTQVSGTTYDIIAQTILGFPQPAVSSSSSAAVALFTTTSASSVVQVTLNAHGYNPGNTFPVLVPTTVGGVTLYGNYIVSSVIDANNFTIQASQQATSSTTGSINGGDVSFVYSFGTGPTVSGTGYGIGGYGRGGYGTGTNVTPSVGVAIPATDWTLDNWGEILIACPINGTLFQPIYAYDPIGGNPQATVIPEAPPLNDGVFVAMPQRQIIAWGSTETGIQDPLLINWSDVNNFTQWVALVTNEAGSYRIPRGSRIVGCIQGPQQGLVWTDVDVWSMQYIGPPFVYSFNEVGTGCGMIARKAAASYGGVVYWMGPSQFFTLSGNGVQPLACPVWDVVFQNIDKANLSKIRVAVNSLFGEITWYYPTPTSGSEVAAYVKYNAFLGEWDYGQLARSAWVDQSVLGPPIGADPNSLYVYQHETDPDADGAPLLASFQSGYAAISEGDYETFVDQVWPDFKFGYYANAGPSATIQLTFFTKNYPADTPAQFGPFSITNTTTFFRPQFRARLVSVQISSSDTETWWRVGGLRYQGAPDGRYG